MASHVLVWNGVPLDVRSLIKYVANVGGGVHYGGPARDSVQAALDSFGGSLTLDGHPVAMAVMVDIAEVAIAGLRPLRDVIDASRDE